MIDEANLITNGDLQGGWATLDGGNQVPNGWQLIILSNGSTMIWPRKHFGNSPDTMPAIAERQPECVFKLVDQLPDNERPGQPKSLIIGGGHQVYKVFHGPSAWRLFQDARLEVGRRVRLTAWLLADTQDVARGPAGTLEPDHCWARVAIGEDIAERNYSVLSSHQDLTGNQRQWNLFTLNHAVTQTSTRIEIVGQQNWPDDPTGVSFFVGPLWLEYIDQPAPEPEPDPDDTAIVIPLGTLLALKQTIAQGRADLQTGRASLLALASSLIDTADIHLADIEQIFDRLLKEVGDD